MFSTGDYVALRHTLMSNFFKLNAKELKSFEQSYSRIRFCDGFQDGSMQHSDLLRAVWDTFFLRYRTNLYHSGYVVLDSLFADSSTGRIADVSLCWGWTGTAFPGGKKEGNVGFPISMCFDSSKSG